MAPNSAEDGESRKMKSRAMALQAGRRLAMCPAGEEVVLTGIAGVFPDSDDVWELGQNLIDKKDLISGDERRWKMEHPEIPQRTGKIRVVNKFDAPFFGIHYTQANSMDPMLRILLEKTYEAIVDAGYHPKELRGSRMGVFIGSCFSESEKTLFYQNIQYDGLGLTGGMRAMMANRISYWLGVDGPSYTVDSACSSSLYALEQAYKAIRDGICDAAIVGGANLCLHPHVSLQFFRLGILCADGKCKVFDEAANGYCRSETICVVLLQKKRDARRVYARLVHAKTNCDGYKEQGITYPSGAMQQKLLEEFYDECRVNPSSLAWVEAHGTGTVVGDPEEVGTIDAVFCSGRTTPLRIGSVKSNLGHSEPASGLVSISKVIVSMERKIIPPNINLTKLRSDIDAFNAGRITVVTEPEPWDGGMVGVNSFGFGGANCHVLLESNLKEKVNGGTPQDDIPRLVAVSGRTKEAVQKILTDLEARPLDVEYVKLWHEIHKMEIPGHLYRGYILKKKNPNEEAIKHVEFFSGHTRELWFVFAGIGSQWPGMGKSLMLIPTFEKAIRECHRILKPKGVDLVRIVTSEDPKTFDNILNSFVGIAAIQIGLVDVLYSIGVVPEGIVGHSVGELGCAYADGCFTAEQTILAAYYRGLASLETNFIYGSMASIGMGYAKAKNEVPSEIDIACHNGPNTCTISGPAEIVKKYVESLKARDIFAKEVKVANIAYHSRYIKDAAPKLLKYLRQIIPKPRIRSKKWISSSVKQAEWNTENAKYSSAEYHTNNLLSSVYFEEAATHIPAKAVVIEIAPHGLLQAILKRSLNNVVNIPLTQMNCPDNIDFFLTALGRLFEAGFNPQLQNLYPSVDFPVSRATPMIAPLIRWDHRDDWHVTKFHMMERIKSGERNKPIGLRDPEQAYISGHVIDGRNLFPATGYMMLVWETIALMKDIPYTEIPVVFENVRFNRATNVPKEGSSIEFTVMVHKGSGNFEVIEGGAAIVTGRVYIPENVDSEMVNAPLPDVDNDSSKWDADILPLTAKDVYKELRLRGYNYKGLFRGITSANNEGTCATVSWVNNYVAFMDNMLQIQILGQDTRGLFVPTFLRKLVINAKKHSEIIKNMPEDKKEFRVEYYKDIELVRSGGIEVRGLKASAITRRKPLGDPVLEKYMFVPHVNPKCQSMEEAVRICMHLALENLPLLKVKTIEVIDSAAKEDAPLISKMIVRVLGDLPLIQAEVVVLSKSDHPLVAELEGVNLTVEDKKMPADQSCLMIVATQLLSRPELLQSALSTLKEGGFLLSREKIEDELEPEDLNICLDYTIGNERIVLLNKKIERTAEPILLKIDGSSFSWIPQMKEIANAATKNQNLILYAEKDRLNGIMGFFNCMRKEPFGNNIRCFFIMDDTAPAFSLSEPLYQTQYEKNLTANVFKDGCWGTYRHLPLEEIHKVKVSHAYVNTAIRGDLSSLNWFEGFIDLNAIKDKSQLKYIYYASMNFRDVMIATGKLAVEVVCRERREQDCLQGFEYAGKAPDGKRYMGMLGKTMSNYAYGKSYLQWPVPDSWTLEDAATVPCIYGTVIYAFVVYGKIKKGESVLIHAGTGGVGQAAINFCTYYECDIYTTVGTEEKRQFIRENFPQIPESHIGNSRDTTFEQMVMRETKGRGVDLVLNSLAEEKLLASLRCLAPGGRFLEIGKFDMAKNNTIGKEVLIRQASFHGVMLDMLFDSGDPKLQNFLVDLLQKHIDCGAIKPIIRTVFEVDQVEQAFRYMAAGKHVGKVLLRVRREEEDKLAIPSEVIMDAIPRYSCKENATYILCGGLGGFGLELADWLVLRGAQNIVLTSRNGVRSGYQSMRIRLWRSYGVNVLVSRNDITTEDGVKALLEEANTLAPVIAIFNLAVVLRDAAFEDQTEETFEISAGPKARATHYLDQLSRKMCPHLEQFVVFSSVSCGRGNLGQTNYGLSNSVMERICELRKMDGLPATAVEWGAVGEVGLVADMAEDNLEFVIGGTLQQRIASCLEVLDYFLKQDNPIVASMVVAEKRSSSSVGATVVDTVVNILGLRDLKTVSLHSTLAELGMDSMMAVEIKQTLEREFEVFLAPQDIRSLTFAKLQEIAAATDSSAAAGDKPPVTGDKAGENLAISEVGLHYFMRVIVPEDQAGESVVRLPSLLHDGSTVEVPPAHNSTVFVFPGVEGVASVMAPLAAFFDVQVLCFQYPFEEIPETIEEMAQIFAMQIKKRLPTGGDFNLIGYSFGGLVALEVVKILEGEGRKGHLWLIDSSPVLMSAVVNMSVLGASDQEEELQVKLLIAFVNLISPQAANEMKDDLYKLSDLESRIKFVQSMSKRTSAENEYSSSYLGKLMIAGYKRIKAVINYSPSLEQLIKAPVTLIRPSEIAIPLPDDYKIGKYFANPVQVRWEDGNHFTILENKKVAEIILRNSDACLKDKCDIDE